jgi:peptide/nickel transport system permease protein
MTRFRTAGSRTWQVVGSDVAARIGFVVLVIVVLASVLAPWIAPFPQERTDLVNRFAGPSGDHWLGTDELGRDLLSRLMYGGRVSLTVSLSAVALASVVGILLGGLAAVWHRAFQSVILRLADIMLGFPEILMAIVIMAILGPSVLNVILAVGIAYSPRFIRLTWSSLLVVREQTYVEAARCAGGSTLRILFRHMLPNILPILLVQITLSLGNVILVESALSFLGLGVQPPQASWGSMINSAQLYLSQSPYPVIFPGLAILLTVLGLNFVGDSLAEGLDPRLRRQAADSIDQPAALTPSVEAAGAAGSSLLQRTET